MLEILEEARAQAPSLEHVVLAPWDELRRGAARRASAGSRSTPSTPYLLTYTSGTTGTPKGVVHVQGGFLVSIAREVGYQADAHPGDVIHFATDMGWIMGPWTVVGGHAARRHARLRRGRARLPARPALAPRSTTSACRSSASRPRSSAR